MILTLFLLVNVVFTIEPADLSKVEQLSFYASISKNIPYTDWEQVLVMDVEDFPADGKVTLNLPMRPISWVTVFTHCCNGMISAPSEPLKYEMTKIGEPKRRGFWSRLWRIITLRW